MKKILLAAVTSLIFISAHAQIISYEDPRLPSELISKINALTPENFDAFVTSGAQETKYNGVAVKIEYNASYKSGHITGDVTIFRRSTGQKITNADIRLPYALCCAHNPSHCFKDSEEIKESTKKNTCTGWKRAQVN